MIDLHCHLDLYPDPHAVARKCAALGAYVLSVTTTPSAWKGTLTLAKEAPRIRTALGLHPQLIHERAAEVALFEQLLPSAQYVGEIGLDGGADFRSCRQQQHDVFDRILRACSAAGGRIMSVHSRGAASRVVDCLLRHPKAGIPVMHWFSGSAVELRRAAEAGFWFSVGPAMLATERGRSLIRLMPQDRVLTETDGPFARRNGQALMPWHVSAAVAPLAAIWSVNASEVAEILHANLRRLIASTPQRVAE